MRLANDSLRYGLAAQALHWAVALLAVALFALGWYMRGLPLGLEAFTLYNLHKSLGLLVLFLTLLRLLWRLISPPPRLPRAMGPLERAAARGAHIGLYLLILLQPASGIASTYFSGLPTVIFGLVTLSGPTRPDLATRALFSAVHLGSSWALALLVAFHVLAALRHHFLRGDDVLRRMLPRAGP